MDAENVCVCLRGGPFSVPNLASVPKLRHPKCELRQHDVVRIDQSGGSTAESGEEFSRVSYLFGCITICIWRESLPSQSSEDMP